MAGSFSDICTRSSKPHLAVVRWPDGRVEAFDFEPEPGNTFFAQLASAAWVPRPGATSTLKPVAGDMTVVHIGDGLLYSDLNATDVYDPRQFWLQDAGGMRYLLDVDQGLLETVDRNGNRTTYGPDGIVPERGIGVSFVRDGLGHAELGVRRARVPRPRARLRGPPPHLHLRRRGRCRR